MKRKIQKGLNVKWLEPYLRAGLLSALLFGALLPIVPAYANTPSYSHEIEQMLYGIFTDLREYRLLDASLKSEQLTSEYPDFILGQLLHAELMSTQGLQQTLVGSDAAYSPRLLELLMEAQSRLRQSTLALDNTRLPNNLLQIGKDIKHIVAVDLEFSRLYLINNQSNRPRISAHHYAASGRGGYGKQNEGDLRTPTGVYRLLEFKSEETLPELYGAGALTLDYPNALDRHFNRTGSGIWLHGIPRDHLSRSPRSSEGCVVMPNDLLLDLHESVDLESTLVVLSGKLGWQTRRQLQVANEDFITLFENWRNAWLNSDLQMLKQLHKKPLYQRAAIGYSPFARQKIKMKQLIGVKNENVTILRYPDLPGGNPVGTSASSTLSQAASKQQDESTRHIMMQFKVPTTADTPSKLNNTAHMTLYWEQNATGQWQVVRIKQDSQLI